jgi:hypothetical protein
MDNTNHKVEAPSMHSDETHPALFSGAYDPHHASLVGKSPTEKIEDYVSSKISTFSSTVKAGEELLSKAFHAIADFHLVGVAKADTLIDEGGNNYYDANTGEQVNNPIDMGGGFI